MKITTKNYFSEVKRIGFENLPEVLKKTHLVLMTKTDQGKNWSHYKKDKEFQKVVELVFEKLGEYIKANKNLSGTEMESPLENIEVKAEAQPQTLEGVKNHLTPRDAAIKFIKPYVLSGDSMWALPNNKIATDEDDFSAHLVNEVVTVTKMYGVDVDHKFSLNDLWKEIIMEFSKEKFGTKTQSQPQSKKERKKRRKIYHKFGEEVKYMKVLLGWRDMLITKPMLLNLIEELQTAIVNKKIRNTSVFAKEISYIQKSLLQIYNGMKAHYMRFQLKEATILMLREAIKKSKEYDEPIPDMSLPEKLDKVSLRGIDEQPKEEVKQKENHIMNSVDFSEMKFESLGFSQKWKDLMGDPSKGFTAMVYGKPKTGKSYLSVDFAGYLARHHGNTLYVAKEEKLDATLHKKLQDKEVVHQNLFVSDFLPDDLSKYEFIFIDSVNKLGLSPQDIENLRTKNPGKSFIFIFQTTKQGQFRGRNEFQHDVDIVIEVPERGKAVQFGRFNQGGEMDIFEVPEPLMGIEPEKNLIKGDDLSGKKKEEGIIKIEAEFAIPLEELAIEYFGNKPERHPEIVNTLDNHSSKISSLIERILKKEVVKNHATIEKIQFSEMDSANLSHGAAYFKVNLKGSPGSLRKIAGEDKTIFYEWEK